jgi:ATP-dependent DNA helicase PIF1
MLNEMRFGRLSPKSIVKFRSLQRDIIYEDGLGATELYVHWSLIPYHFLKSPRFPRREDVERSNTIRIRNLQTEEFTYKARDGGTIQDLKQREKMLANFMAPDSLTLRVDAQVMLIKNVDETLVNGSMGRVIKFCDPASYATELDDVTTIGGSKTAVGAAASKAKSGNQLPVVEFMIGRSGTRTVIVTEETWKAELPNGEVQASRTQASRARSWLEFVVC